MTALAEPLTVDERLDRLSGQIEEIAEDLRRQRESREQWQELAQTLVPVSRGAFDLASRELDALSPDVTVEDALRLARTLARSLPELEALVAQMKSMTDLGAEVATISGAGVSKLSELLAEADRKGYFAVARGGATVLDRVVTSLADEDFEALADQLERTLTAARGSLSANLPAPSTLGLLRRLRDPQTRRGLARALDLLNALGADNGSPDNTDHEKG